ncbi:bifunctional indole-3-glycerol-phosphate synthase TrpC/phosphoribosylanthranilate isomerase TrpF [Buchnera aphidicola]|uniref:bifunctional indole-3-glycerol-phosphate synthase TrpC/phosphoribosylanthranilate isomerase TrpF n=1 Tax=Buchnera aphidicola TaxID=9 RepID=UPI003BEF4AB7
MQETILNRIISDKKKWIQERKNEEPLMSFKYKINTKTRDFYTALTSKKPVFILECKQFSPSLGLIRKDFNLFKIANIYKKYASAISVLTDEKYFHGNLKFINKVRNHVFQPILCKDFFIDTYQIYLARYYQADAILLMLSVLNDAEYIKLSNTAKNMNMGILTEINNTKELHRALSLNASVIGINNRNLHDLSINLNRTRKLAPLIPKDKIIISESGIKKYHNIRELSSFVNGFLIGSSLMVHSDLDVSIRSIIMGENKICGLTRSIDAQCAVKYGAVYGGLIFIQHSKRNITIQIAKNIILNNNLRYVGVFQNEKIEKIVNISLELSLYAVQLHGDENQNYINLLRTLLPKKIQIWKAFSITVKVPECNWKNIDIYIFDSFSPGNNQSFDWSLLSHKKFHNVILAGGINIKNCTLASKLYFLGLDLNSGIEDIPGIKNHEKIKIIFHKLRYYF